MAKRSEAKKILSRCLSITCQQAKYIYIFAQGYQGESLTTRTKNFLFNQKFNTMSQTKTTQDKTLNDEVTNKDFVNKHLGNAIMLSIDLESSFKLYSFRVITPETFIARTKELVEQFNSAK